jgi:hypothetical protein
MICEGLASQNAAGLPGDSGDSPTLVADRCDGKRREIFILDEGEPVKIVDLARNLILISGLRAEEDIRIEFTGIRWEESFASNCHHDPQEYTTKR